VVQVIHSTTATPATRLEHLEEVLLGEDALEALGRLSLSSLKGHGGRVD
jgi:hypothetical protein